VAQQSTKVIMMNTDHVHKQGVFDKSISAVAKMKIGILGKNKLSFAKTTKIHQMTSIISVVNKTKMHP